MSVFSIYIRWIWKYKCYSNIINMMWPFDSTGICLKLSLKRILNCLLCTTGQHILMYTGKHFAFAPPVYEERIPLAALDYNHYNHQPEKPGEWWIRSISRYLMIVSQQLHSTTQINFHTHPPNTAARPQTSKSDTLWCLKYRINIMSCMSHRDSDPGENWRWATLVMIL